MREITDLAEVTQVDSTQLNAEDLMYAPLDVTVVKVVTGPSQQQKSEFRLKEAKPYRPCKTMARVVKEIWGRDPRTWQQPARMRLYRDPTVRNPNGEIAGGIRISHMSGIDRKTIANVPAGQGKRLIWPVEPLDTAPPIAQGQGPVEAFVDPLADILGDITAEQVAAWCHGRGAKVPTTPALRAELAGYLREHPEWLDEMRGAS